MGKKDANMEIMLVRAYRTHPSAAVHVVYRTKLCTNICTFQRITMSQVKQDYDNSY